MCVWGGEGKDGFVCLCVSVCVCVCVRVHIRMCMRVGESVVERRLVMLQKVAIW